MKLKIGSSYAFTIKHSTDETAFPHLLNDVRIAVYDGKTKRGGMHQFVYQDGTELLVGDIKTNLNLLDTDDADAKYAYVEDLYDTAFLDEHKESYPTLKFKKIGAAHFLTGDVVMQISGTKAELIRWYTNLYLDGGDESGDDSADIDALCHQLKLI